MHDQGVPQLLRIGKVADRTGVTAKTLRFYEEAGVLAPADRSPAGYRLYASSAIERVALVRAAQSAGLSLAEIAELCDALERPGSEDARRRIDEARDRVDSALASLKELRRRLISEPDARTMRRSS